MIAAFLANWKLVLVGLALLGAGALVLKINNDAYDRGYAAYQAEVAAATREKTDAANRADSDAARCSLDPACRLRDDGFKRD